jgi:hypothetical protein
MWRLPDRPPRPRDFRVVDHRAGGRVSPVSDGDGSNEHGVRADPDEGADGAAMLGHPVVVHEHRGRADVAVLTDARVAYISKVRHLGSGADVAAFDLDIRADMDAVVQDGPGAQVGVRADRHAGADGSPVADGARDLRALAHCGVGQGGLRADRGAGRDRRGAVQVDGREQRDVRLERDAGVDPGGGRVDDGHAGAHVLVEQARVVGTSRRRELDAVVDARRLLVRRDHRAYLPPVADEDRDDLGQVLLALGVVGGQPADGVAQQGVVERVDAGGDLGGLALVGRRVALLDDPGHRPVRGPDDPAVPGGVRRDTAEHGGRRAGRGMVGDERRECRRRQQRGVARDDDDHAVLIGGHGAERDPHGVPGAPLLVLHDRRRGRRGRGEVLADSIAMVADHHHGVPGVQGVGGGEHVAEQRSSGETVQHLRRRGRLHPGALAGGEDDDR